MTSSSGPKRLTKRAVDALEPGGYSFCVDPPGFGVRCQKRDKAFIYRYRLNGRRTFVTLGVHGRPHTVETARVKAKEYAAMVARGIDPAEEKRKGKVDEALTLRAAADLFLAGHVEAKRKSSTAAEYKRLLDKNILPKLGTRRLDALVHADIARLHLAASKTPYQANRIVAVLSKLFAWAERQGLHAGPNPCKGIERYREEGRERFLSPEELGRLGQTLDALEAAQEVDVYAAAAIRLLIFTGARRGEVLALRWDWIDTGAGVARLPDNKSGAKTLHLPPPALEVLKGLPHLEGNPFVIVGKKPGTALVGLPKIWERVRAKAGLDGVRDGVRLHDLRHSFASAAANAGTSLLVIGKLLGHTQYATTQRYAHLANDPVRLAGESTAASIAAALKSRRTDA